MSVTLKDFPSQLTPSRPVEGSGEPDGVPPEFEFPSETDGKLALAWAFAEPVPSDELGLLVWPNICMTCQWQNNNPRTVATNAFLGLRLLTLINL